MLKSCTREPDLRIRRVQKVPRPRAAQKPGVGPSSCHSADSGAGLCPPERGDTPHSTSVVARRSPYEPVSLDSGAVIQLRSRASADSAGYCDLCRCQQVSVGAATRPQPGRQGEPPGRARSPQVTTVTPPTRSGFAARSSLAPIQEDPLKSKESVLVSDTEDVMGRLRQLPGESRLGRTARHANGFTTRSPPARNRYRR